VIKGNIGMAQAGRQVPSADPISADLRTRLEL
jgi:hypothetical protein